jgi:hypothetical protein
MRLDVEDAQMPDLFLLAPSENPSAIERNDKDPLVSDEMTDSGKTICKGYCLNS